MPQQFLDFGLSTLAAPITNTATEFSVGAGHGARFDTTLALSAQDFLEVTLCASPTDPLYEVVRITAPRSTDTFPTIVRHATRNKAWPAGTQVRAGLTAAALAQLDVGGWGFPMTAPAHMGNTMVTIVPVANWHIFHRVLHGSMTPVSKIRIRIGAQSGNICVGVARGPLGLAAPTTIIASSGSVACPAVGEADIALGSTVRILPGDFIFLGADNTTATTLTSAGNSGAAWDIAAGCQYRPTTPAFPLTVGAAPTLSAYQRAVPILLGIV